MFKSILTTYFNRSPIKLIILSTSFLLNPIIICRKVSKQIALKPEPQPYSVMYKF